MVTISAGIRTRIRSRIGIGIGIREEAGVAMATGGSEASVGSRKAGTSLEEEAALEAMEVSVWPSAFSRR